LEKAVKADSVLSTSTTHFVVL